MYGLYIRIAQDLDTDLSNIDIAKQANTWIWKPLDSSSPEQVPAGTPTSHVFYISRDWRDSLVHTWKTYSPEMTWEEFRDSPKGFASVVEHNAQISEMSFTDVFSYEELAKEPQVFLTKLVNYMLPRQDNPQLESFGQRRRDISLDQIDLVVQETNARDLREGAVERGLLDAVGVYKHFLNRSQIEEIDEFVASL